MRKGNQKYRSLFVELTRPTDAAIKLIASITHGNRRKISNATAADIMQYLSALLSNLRNEQKVLHIYNNEAFCAEHLSQDNLRKLNNKNIKRTILLPEFPLAKKIYEMLKIRSSLIGDEKMRQSMQVPQSINNSIIESLEQHSHSNDNATLRKK